MKASTSLKQTTVLKEKIVDRTRPALMRFAKIGFLGSDLNPISACTRFTHDVPFACLAMDFVSDYLQQTTDDKFRQPLRLYTTPSTYGRISPAGLKRAATAAFLSVR